MQNKPTLLDAAEEVARILHENQIGVVVIGAAAMAAHHYVRLTHDIDLGVNASIQQLRLIENVLKQAHFEATLCEPDGQDPLGGVIDVTGSFGLVQIISFADRFPIAIEDALKTTTACIRPNSLLKLIPLPQLVALKLYAGGLKSKADIVELLLRNPDADLDALNQTCDRYRLKGLDTILAEVQS
jgi:hypothetical protein